MRRQLMLRNIEEIRERLVRDYDPDRIILFGSHAKGVAREGSDIDLLIVKQTSDRPVDRRIRVEKMLADRQMPLDIVVYTPKEMRRLYSIGSPFIEEVVETGRVLYMRKATEGWMQDAQGDLASALVLLEHGRYKAACYHSQQCVEKGLKAAVMEKGGRPAKVHDIVELLNAAKGIGCGIEMPMDDAIFLNSVYKGGYPAEDGLLPRGEPSKSEATKAVKAAKGLMKALGSVLK